MKSILSVVKSNFWSILHLQKTPLKSYEKGVNEKINSGLTHLAKLYLNVICFL